MATYMNQTNSGRIIVQQTSPSAIIVQPDNERKIILKGSGGLKGETGDAATITVGSTTTGEPGTSASVVNSGTSSDAVLDFVIPKGSKGDKGDTGATGATGPANTLSIGTVQGGETADATITGTAPNQTLNLTLPKGDKGDTGSTGPAGPGVASGGTTGQVLTKNSGTDYDTTWTTPTTYSDFVGATSSVAGSHGLVPAPTTSDPDKFLKGDGTWGTPPGATYTGGTGIDISGGTIAVDTDAVPLKADYTIKKSYTIDLTAQSTSNFYPIVFTRTQNVVDCEIHSEGGGSGIAYNQNVLHFQMVAQGWSDLSVRKRLIVLQEGAYDANEITIGCVGLGDHQGNNCVWLRGGIRYFFTCNVTAEAHTSSYTISDETFSVGTNYYGGTNANVTIYYTPQNVSKDVVLMEDVDALTVTTAKIADGAITEAKMDATAWAKKVNVASIDLTGETTTLLSLAKALGANNIDYARWECTTNVGSANISDKPTGGVNASFVCEAYCNRWTANNDYRYQLICWVNENTNPFVAYIADYSSSITWERLRPTVNDATLTIQKNGTTVETFTANSSTNKTANITVPTKTSDLTNDGATGDSTYVEADNYATASTAGVVSVGDGLEITEGGVLSVDSSKKDVYSTTETRVGTWIDGKPLYRKVFSGTASSSTMSLAIGTNDIATVVKADVLRTITGATTDTVGSYYASSTDYFRYWVRKTQSDVYQVEFRSSANAYSYTMVIEYTKTTD